MPNKKYRAKLKRARTNREYNIILIDAIYPLYWDEGYYQYPRYRRGFKNPNKYIFFPQRREYRSWKYNRKNQYKE